MWKIVLGLLLIVGSLGNLKQISDWSYAQAVGFNIAMLAMIVGGAWLCYSGFKNRHRIKI